MAQRTRPHTTARFPRRAIGFEFDPAAVPRDWFADDVVATAYYGVFSLSFPDGERFFIESVRHFKDAIVDPELGVRVKAFVGQETMHGKEHDAFNALLRAHGFDASGETERWLVSLLDAVRARLSPEAKLACTAGLEHWTAILGAKVLRDPALRERFHPAVQDLWVWHSLEETEHKAVAFDVYEAVSGRYGVRAAAMVAASAIFLCISFEGLRRMLREAGVSPGVRGYARAARILLGRGGPFERFLPAYLAYFRPGFHPDDDDTRALVAEWRERLFGGGATLAHARTTWIDAA